MVVRNVEGFVEVLLVERSPSGFAGAGDLRLQVRVAFSTFTGEYDQVWIESNAFRDFLAQLRTLEAQRRGSAILSSMSPGELDLEIHSIGSAGQMAASGQLGRHTLISDGGWAWCQIPFYFQLSSPSLLPELLAEFQLWHSWAGA